MEQKIKIFFYGILAVITFSLVLEACPAETSSSKPAANVYVLKFSGQVYYYKQDTDQNTEPVTGIFSSLLAGPQKFKGNLDVSDGDLGGTGEILGGKLNYIIDVEPPLSPINEGGSLDDLKGMYEDLRFSPEDAKVAAVALEITDSKDYSGLLKTLLVINVDNILKPTKYKLTSKTVNYVYVNKNLKITADKKTFDNKDFNNDFDLSIPIPISLTSEKINLSLKKGWNALCSEIQVDIPRELLPVIYNPELLSTLDLTALKLTGSLKMSVGDPGDLKWTLIPSPPPDIIPPEYLDFE